MKFSISSYKNGNNNDDIAIVATRRRISNIQRRQKSTTDREGIIFLIGYRNNSHEKKTRDRIKVSRLMPLLILSLLAITMSFDCGIFHCGSSFASAFIIPSSSLSSSSLSHIHTTRRLIISHHDHQRLPLSSMILVSSAVRKNDVNSEGSDGENGASKTPSNQNKTALHSLLLSVFLSAVIVFVGVAPLPAHAGFGPSSGATTSATPGLKTPQPITSNELTVGTKDGKKLNILIQSSIDERRLQEFSTQIDLFIDSLRTRFDEISDGGSGENGDDQNTDSSALTNNKNAADLKELEEAKLLQTKILEQGRMLARLQAQPYWFNYLAAFVGSTVSTLVMHPVDTIKTRLQVNLSMKATTAAVAGSLPIVVNNVTTVEAALNESYPQSNGVINNGNANTFPRDDGTITLLQLPQEVDLVSSATSLSSTNNVTAQTASTTSFATNSEVIVPIGGIDDQEAPTSPLLYEGLYEGLIGNLFKEVPPSAVYLGVYETIKYALSPIVPNPDYLLGVYLIAGASGELIGSIIRAPAETVKVLLQSKAKGNALEAAQTVFGTPEGRSNVLRAWSASIGRDVPFGAIQLATFELIKASILNNPNIDFDSSTIQAEAIIGAFAGGLGSLITCPADVITTRIITQTNNKNDHDKEEEKLLGAIEMGKKIYKEEGPMAFFSGAPARVGYWTPAISIFLTCYCLVRQAGVRNDLFGGAGL